MCLYSCLSEISLTLRFRFSKKSQTTLLIRHELQTAGFLCKGRECSKTKSTTQERKRSMTASGMDYGMQLCTLRTSLWSKNHVPSPALNLTLLMRKTSEKTMYHNTCLILPTLIPKTKGLLLPLHGTLDCSQQLQLGMAQG